jgi:glycosyltransferase involved in cell wall biosynthesis
MIKNHHRWIALLGREDEPTDALEDYCKILAEALFKRGYSLEMIRIAWAEQGWYGALRDADKRFAEQPYSWALVQYTPLAWSRRGFPLRFTRMIRRLKDAGMQVLIVFHDPEPFGGHRFRDRVRRRVQLAVMRLAARLADKIVTTISPERVSWMNDPRIRAKALLVPVGSNLPATLRDVQSPRNQIPMIIVFGFSDIASEISLIAAVLCRAAEEVGPLHLTVFGRGAKVAGTLLQPLLADSHVELSTFGILEPQIASALLANADVQLFIRAGLSSRRGSGIAGIACGLPIIGFSDSETTFPITEAGVRLVPLGDQEGLLRELVLALKQQSLLDALRLRNLEAAERYFSWDRIADAYLSFLGGS